MPRALTIPRGIVFNGIEFLSLYLFTRFAMRENGSQLISCWASIILTYIFSRDDRKSHLASCWASIAHVYIFSRDD